MVQDGGRFACPEDDTDVPGRQRVDIEPVVRREAGGGFLPTPDGGQPPAPHHLPPS